MHTDLLDPVSSSFTPAARTPARGAVLAGRVMSGLAALFLAFDAAIKLTRSSMAVAATAALGYPPDIVFPLGLIELGALALYLVPRTAPLGALIWTGYLGGAIATHARLGNPLASHTLFPIYVAVLLWGGLWLRDRRVRGILA